MGDYVIIKCPHCGDNIDHDNILEDGTTLKRIAGTDDTISTFNRLKEIWYCSNCDNLFEMHYKFEKIVPLIRKENEKEN